MYRRILVPLDGSPTADAALNEAVGLAAVHGASLLLLHVIEDYPLAMEAATLAAAQSVKETLRDQGKPLLASASQVAQEAGVSASAMQDEGKSVSDAILEHSAQCDLVVMGTHGRRGINRLVMGSEAERVARSSLVPVMLVRHPRQP